MWRRYSDKLVISFSFPLLKRKFSILYIKFLCIAFDKCTLVGFFFAVDKIYMFIFKKYENFIVGAKSCKPRRPKRLSTTKFTSKKFLHVHSFDNFFVRNCFFKINRFYFHFSPVFRPRLRLFSLFDSLSSFLFLDSL